MYRYEEPLLKPRSSAYGSNYWCFRSRKLHRRVAVFSNLEYENILCLEMDSNVKWYCEYPLQIKMFIGGKDKKITFSAWVLYSDGKESFQGVAYEASDKEEGNQEIECMSRWCTQNNFCFEYRNDKTIEKGNYFIRNLSVLAAKSRRLAFFSEQTYFPIINYLKQNTNISIEELQKNDFMDKSKCIDVLADLYYKGFISFNNLENECLTDRMEVIYIGQ